MLAYMTDTNRQPSQPFPAGAKLMRGPCSGAFCTGAGDWHTKDVVRARVGETWRTSQDLALCADCLADFAIANDALSDLGIPSDMIINVVTTDESGRVRADKLPRFRVWAESEDGLYHEVRGELP